MNPRLVRKGVNGRLRLAVEAPKGRFWPDWDGTGMEQRGRNRWQTSDLGIGPKRLDLATTVATGCHRLPERQHGKEGVDGSSPSEGSAKAPEIGALSYVFSRRGGLSGPVWSRLWSFRAEKSVRRARGSGPHGISRSGVAELGVERAALQPAGLVDGEQPFDCAFAASGAASE
jgi:hypothetical protein